MKTKKIQNQKISKKDLRIKDNPSIAQLSKSIRALKVCRFLWPILKPLYALLGADLQPIENSLKQIDVFDEKMKILIKVAEKFNDFFGSRGWILFKTMDSDVAYKAVMSAENGDIEGGEKVLLDYYCFDTVKKHLRMMNAINAFRPRMRLAEKALIDYGELRYHACIPVILALADGMTNDLNPQHLGFFAEQTTLNAWDSFAGSDEGLNELKKILSKGRRKLNTEEIFLPYRNGIMHGMDVNYDNKTVAAKTWALLFSLGEWALQVESETLMPLPPETKLSGLDLIKQIKDLNDEKQRLNSWQPRNLQLSEDDQNKGEIFELDSPEKRICDYLLLWKQKNYGFMSQCISAIYKLDSKSGPARIREVYRERTLHDYQVVKITDIAAAISQITVQIVYSKKMIEVKRVVDFEMRNEDQNGEICAQGKVGSQWKLFNWYLNDEE